MNKKPILVTGSHRSGTTWVGKMIAESRSVYYIHEPFNIIYHPRHVNGTKFDYQFAYVSDKNESVYCGYIKHALGLSYNFIGEAKTIRYPKDLLRLSKNYIKYLKHRVLNIRPLMKDPMAVFSAEWLASRFNMDVIVLIRHPAAFTGSLKRLNWKCPFSDLLKQPLLIKDHLYPFESEIKEYANKEHDIVDQAALIWKLIYYVILKYQRKHKDWAFIRHEDLSQKPLTGFQALFKKLNLGFSKHIRKAIKEYSDSANPTETPVNDFRSKVKLNSKLNIWNWKNRLTISEIERIRKRVGDISYAFYSDEDWK